MVFDGFDEIYFVFFFRLLAIAEETLAEFMSKATGTAVNWVPMVGMKVCTSYFAQYYNASA